MMKTANNTIEPAEIEHQILEERKHQRGRKRRLADLHQRDAGKAGNDGLDARRVRPANPLCDCFVTFR